MGVLGCVICIVGSVIVLHAPEERTPCSTDLGVGNSTCISDNATTAVVLSPVLILHPSPHYGTKNSIVHLGIFSLIGSLTAFIIAIKLTIEGINQVSNLQTWIFIMVAISCISTRLTYLNKVLIKEVEEKRKLDDSSSSNGGVEDLKNDPI